MQISVVTCSFNSEKTIERTIKSVLDQKFDDYEYIIVDGKSTDGTLDIIKRYEPLFSGKLHWFSEKDHGIYDAMNKGIMKSAGDYIWLVNSDDYLEPNALQIISNLIHKKERAVICGQVVLFSEVEDKKQIVKITPDKSDIEFRKKRMGIVHPATVVARNIYNKYGLYDDRFLISADMDWFLRIRENNVQIEFINTILSNMSDGGISNQNDNIKKRIHDWKILYKKHTQSKFEYWRFLIYRIVSYYKQILLK